MTLKENMHADVENFVKFVILLNYQMHLIKLIPRLRSNSFDQIALSIVNLSSVTSSENGCWLAISDRFTRYATAIPGTAINVGNFRVVIMSSYLIFERIGS